LAGFSPFGGSADAKARDFFIHFRKSATFASTPGGAATYSFMLRPGMGSKIRAPGSRRSSPRSASPRRRIRLSWWSPVNMFPFTKAQGYPNIERRSTEGASGSAAAKVLTRDSGLFFHFVAAMFQAYRVPRRRDKGSR
jgi:hypothetical protein